MSDSKALLLLTATLIRFAPAEHFNGAPGNLTVRLSDATVLTIATAQDISGAIGGINQWSSGTVALSTSVTAVNDAPVVTASGSDTGFTNGVFTGSITESSTAGEGTPTQQLLTGVTVSDVDLATTANLADDVFGAGTITVTLASRQAGDKFTLDGAPTGVDSTSGGIADSGDFVINLKSSVTLTEVKAILEAIQFQHTSDIPPTVARIFTVTLNDKFNLDADEHTAGSGSEQSVTLSSGSITINQANDPPSITDGPDTVSINETDAALTTSGSLTVTDVDTTDVVTATRTLAVSGNNSGLSNETLLGMLTLDKTTVIDSSHTTGMLGWSFDSGSEKFDYLEKGETLILTYAVTATDSGSGTLTDTETVTITIVGTNDTPTITNGADTAALTESDGQLTTSGSMTVTDVDTADTVNLTVDAVALSGTFTSSSSPLPSSLSATDYQALKAMLNLSASSNLDANSPDGTSFNWTFTSGATGDSAFDFLREGETLILTYTIKAADNSGATGSDKSSATTSTVTVTITGTNDTLSISNGADTVSLTETDTKLTAISSMTVTDIDLTDTVSVGVTSVAIGSGSFAGTVPTALTDSENAVLKAMMSVTAGNLAANPTDGTNFDWTFTSGTSGDRAFQFLAKDETLVLVYTITVTDNSGTSSGEVTTTTSTVTVTITGTNDVPTIEATNVAGAVTEDGTTIANNPNTTAIENGAYLTDSGSIDFADLDLTDKSLVTVSHVVNAVISTTGSVSTELATALQNLTDTFKISGTGVGSDAHSGTVNWSFALDNSLTQYLTAGETVTAMYRITVTDDSGAANASRTQDVVVTLTGGNDNPDITVSGGNSALWSGNETNGVLTTSGTLSVEDVDLTNTVAPSVTSVVASGVTTGLGSDNAA